MLLMVVVPVNAYFIILLVHRMNEIPLQSLLHSLLDGDNIILITTIFLISHYVSGSLKFSIKT